MYGIGDLLVYEGSGCICKVSDIAGFDFQGNGESRLYYVLKPLLKECVIYNPVDNDSVFMRPVISKDEALKLIDTIPEMDASDVSVDTPNFQEARRIAQHYESIIRSRDCAELLKLTMLIYEKKKAFAAKNREIGSVESASLKKAEGVLFEEFSIALGIPKDGVQKYIESRIGARGERKPQ